MGYIGPIITETNENFPGSFNRAKFSRQEKYESKPRNNVTPLPYLRYKSQSSDPHYDCRNFGAKVWIDYYSQPAVARCEQAAYGKLVGKIKTMQQGWGETLATRKQAFEMMLHRIGTLTLAARRLKRGDIPGFCRALGVTPKRERSKLKKASSTWLEYHFGWEPLYRDIYSACHALTEDVPSGTVKGVAIEQVDDREIKPPGYVSQTWNGRVIVKLQGDYYVENPDKFLLNQLGVINPIGLAWELVPFSFAVDWFIPVGQFLGSLTDFYGVGRRNEFTSVMCEIEGHSFDRVASSGSSTAVRSIRRLGVSVPKPTFKLFRGFSPVRGATAIALLVGTLRSLK